MSTNKLYIILFAYICIIVIQFTNIKLGPIKIGECTIFLFILFYALREKTLYVNNDLKYTFCLITYFLVVSYIVYPFVNYYPPNNIIILKSPALIPLSRYFQLLLCLSFAYIVFKTLNHRSLPSYNLGVFNKHFFIGNAILACIFLLGYLFEGKLWSEGIFYYNNFRLKGFFNEGGPLGLFYSSIAYYALFHKKYLYTILFVIIVILAKSKAGIIALILFYLIHMFRHIKNVNSTQFSKKILKLSLIAILIFTFSVIGTYCVGKNYYKDYLNIKNEITNRTEDRNLIMGRIAMAYIAPNIITDHPFLGVGLGNYSNVRNAPKYRKFIPKVDAWDLGGLGGIFKLLVECGIIGVILFFVLCIKLFLFNKIPLTKAVPFISLFLFPFFLGLQLYFFYPWLFLGLFLHIKHNINLKPFYFFTKIE
ncbi:O-antigen ligase family protein [Desulfovermiculus halophilus]|uniref:O-antigen ligase family protein n=1 Tax=Desulfovermiculus halophilus TaxID=339722 RepID=UPI0009FD8A3E|nr:O-antigen ligase family protein [Desulfovermiculus halophilus]